MAFLSAGRRPLAIVGGTIIDGNGGKPIDRGVIVVDGERILEVGDSSVVLPPNTTEISAAGKFIMPGMMDANVHLFFAHTPAELIRYDDRYEDVITEAAQVALRSGVTTVFDTWGPRQALTNVRNGINEGKLVGSRIFFAGNIIGFGGPTTDDFFPLTREILSKAKADEIDARFEQGVGADLLWMTPEQVRMRLRAYIESGDQDFLKYAGSGHVQMQLLSFSETIQRIIVEEGHRAGLTVQAHTTSPESLRIEIESGADILQHGDITGLAAMPEELLRAIVERKIACAAMLATRKFSEWNKMCGSESKRIAQNEIKDENDRRLIAAGATLLLTTDSGVLTSDRTEIPLLKQHMPPSDSPVELGTAHVLWLQAAHELGMKPMDALLAATRNPARAYKVDQDLGTLEKGKLADLLVLAKNPLEDVENYRSVELVMKAGEIVERESLPKQRLLSAPTL